MRKTTKTILIFFNLIALLILSSCEKELYDDGMYKSKIKIEKVSLRKSNPRVSINPNLFKAVSKVKDLSTNVTGKIVYDSINNLYFDDEAGKKITKEDEDYESYTFKILNSEEEKVKNLVFIKNKAKEFDAFIVKYNFTDEQLKTVSEIQLQQSETSYIDLNNKFGSPELICIDMVQLVDNGELHGADSPPVYEWVVTGSFCGWIGGGGETSGGGDGGASGTGNGSGSSSGGGSGGGGGTTFNTTPPKIITTPVHGPPQINHLAKLYSLTEVAAAGQTPNIIRTKLNAFKYQLKTATEENGIEYRRGPVTNGSYSYYPVNPIWTTYNETHFADPAINTSVYIHFHPGQDVTLPDGTISPIAAVPSDGDFEAFSANFFSMGNSSNRNDLTSITVTRRGLYALRAGNPAQVLEFRQYLSVDAQRKDFEIKFQKNVIKKGHDKAIEKFNAQGGGTEEQLQALVDSEMEKWLARFILDFNTNVLNTGILLFHGDINLGTTTWTELQTTREP
jgi:uncharacterized membrane protein YgcG